MSLSQQEQIEWQIRHHSWKHSNNLRVSRAWKDRSVLVYSRFESVTASVSVKLPVVRKLTGPMEIYLFASYHYRDR